MLQDDLILALVNTSEYWIVDSGDSCHATPHRKFFHDYVPGDFGYVLLWDVEPCKIVGMFKVQIKLNNGNEWLLKDVSCIPAMKINMITTGQLEYSGCLSTFGKMWWKIIKGALVMEK